MTDAQFPFDPRDLMKRVVTRGDLATVLLAAPVGFVGDVALSLGGFISPGACAVLTASTALGMKNAVQAMFTRETQPSTIQAAPENEIVVRAKRLVYSIRKLLEEHDRQQREAIAAEEAMLTQEIHLYEDGLSDDATLEAAIAKALTVYRSSLGLERKETALARPRRRITSI